MHHSRAKRMLDKITIGVFEQWLAHKELKIWLCSVREAQKTSQTGNRGVLYEIARHAKTIER